MSFSAVTRPRPPRPGREMAGESAGPRHRAFSLPDPQAAAGQGGEVQSLLPVACSSPWWTATPRGRQPPCQDGLGTWMGCGYEVFQVREAPKGMWCHQHGAQAATTVPPPGGPLRHTKSGPDPPHSHTQSQLPQLGQGSRHCWETGKERLRKPQAPGSKGTGIQECFSERTRGNRKSRSHVPNTCSFVPLAFTGKTQHHR